MINLTGKSVSWPAVMILAIVSLITAFGGLIGERMRVRDKAIVRSAETA